MDHSLAHLAEIASVVSRHQQESSIASSIHHLQAATGNNNNNNNTIGSVATALRKRNSLSLSPAQDLFPKPLSTAKKQKTESSSPSASGAAQNVRFREYQAEIWSEKFEELCAFRRYFGHCHVPHTYEANAPLAQWVKRQRYQYKLRMEGKRSTLSDERVRLLNELGFIWNSHDAVWEERLNELLLFKKIYGHCIVPSSYDPNPQLAVWVKRQRRQYKFLCEGKATSMTPERIAKLEQHGFAWDCRKNKDEETESRSLNSTAISTEKSSIVVQKVKEVAKYPISGNNGKKEETKPVNKLSSYPRCEFLSFGSRRF